MQNILKLLIIAFLLIYRITSALALNPEVKESKMEDKELTLPDYVVFDINAGNQNDKSVRIKAKEINFPLSESDSKDITILEKKFDKEENCAGLAAPQIGILKRIIIFALPDDPDLKKWRPDLTQTMPKTIWLNPSFEGADNNMSEDYEACFSVPNIAAPVKRYTKIKYKAYDLKGKLIQGQAEGFLARIIQHEIDHLNGILFIDHVAPDSIKSLEEYREMRKKAMEAQ